MQAHHHSPMASAINYLVFFSLLLFSPTLAMANIALTSSLSAINDNSSWNSPSGDFAFGFHQLNNPNTFLLAIWYANIPDKTIVWHANSTNPIQRGSRLELRTTGLVLNDPQGRTIWTAEPDSTVSDAAMLDSGNFVLSDSDSVKVWESFENPTDTILPTQVLGWGGKLYSRLNEANYSKGRFELQYFSNGYMKLYPVAWPTEYPYDENYYSINTSSTNSSESGFQLVFGESGEIYIEKGNGERVQLSWQTIAPPRVNYYYRATLDFDGVFRQYAYPNGSAGDRRWSVVRYIPENICIQLTHTQQGSGVCGFNSYCNQTSGTPSCHCPPGYSPIDPNNQFGGCKPNFAQGCGVDDQSVDPEELYYFQKLQGLNWPFGDYDRLEPYNQTDCEQSCLRDCLCAAAIFDGLNSRCWKKKMPLSNGRVERGSLVLIKVRRDVSSVPGMPNIPSYRSGNTKTEKQILLGSLGSSMFFNVLFLVLIARIVLLRRKKKRPAKDPAVIEPNLRLFSFKELDDAQKWFCTPPVKYR
ncbi:unnamed protein product [Ilex paraguariensis]|uniref:Bulb-type lectin domain-containing protein n=1 Tax=Ilex paraguariensis TaxID=185542 RepID=A0ABC8UWB5_9AQUA